MKTVRGPNSNKILGMTFPQIASLAILTCILFVLIGIFLLMFLRDQSFSPLHLSSSAGTPIQSTTMEVPPTETLLPSPTTEWEQHIIDLYDISVDVPHGWIIQEINRRPEPTNIGDPITGHDCAEYQISTFNGLSSLSLRPTCGFSEGVPGTYPPGTVIINPDELDALIGRFYDGEKYIYSDVFTVPYTDLTGDHQETGIWEPPVIILGQGRDFIAIEVTFQYLGPQEQLEKILEIIDRIVLSLKRL